MERKMIAFFSEFSIPKHHEKQPWSVGKDGRKKKKRIGNFDAVNNAEGRQAGERNGR